jgi:hypothetical protein
MGHQRGGRGIAVAAMAMLAPWTCPPIRLVWAGAALTPSDREGLMPHAGPDDAMGGREGREGVTVSANKGGGGL